MQAIINSVFFRGLLILVSFACYFITAYRLDRSNTPLLLGIIAVLFASYYLLIMGVDTNSKRLNQLTVISFVFRTVFIFSIPSLSDDFYRFIWDGRLLEMGYNPYAHLPGDIIKNSVLTGESNLELFTKMNSPNYYTIYPPVLQVVFFISAKMSFGSNLGAILVLRSIILITELLTYHFFKKLLELLNLDRKVILWYLLNPLIIIELSGNLHFEAVMILFLVLCMYFLFRYNYYTSAVFFSLAILTKMIPLIFLPLLIRKIGLKSGIQYSIIVGTTVLLAFAPFINQQLIHNIGSSIELYFQKFEFNACFYSVLRWVGYLATGYNQISIIGKILPAITFLLVTYVSLRKGCETNNSNLLQNMSSILLIYFLLGLVVHPWYLSTLVFFTALTNKKMSIVWSGLVYLSYATYSKEPYTENPLILFLEYGLLFLWMIYERLQLKRS